MHYVHFRISTSIETGAGNVSPKKEAGAPKDWDQFEAVTQQRSCDSGFGGELYGYNLERTQQKKRTVPEK